MLSQEPSSRTIVRKLVPRAALPAADLLRQLSVCDQRALSRRLSEPVECLFYPSFLEPNTERFVMGPPPAGPAQRSAAVNDDSGVDLLATPELVESASTLAERHLFLRFNYCRYRVLRLLADYQDRMLDSRAASELLRWERASQTSREELVRANVPLVLAMAKRTRISSVDYADLISEGNLALMRSVDKFDCSRGYKFSTYACRSILKSFSRVATRTSRYRGLFPTEFDPTLEKSDMSDSKRRGVEDECVQELRSILGQNLASLNDVEQRVIRARFALDEAAPLDAEGKSKTLEQVGELIGVTKERVRQIQNKALSKLRNVLEGAVLAR